MVEATESSIVLAVDRFQSEGISLAEAAEIAGVSWAGMKEILLKKGIPLRLGPETLQEAEEEVQALRDFFAE